MPVVPIGREALVASIFEPGAIRRALKVTTFQ